MEPRAELLEFPKEYGKPTEVMKWQHARTMLEEATMYWVASVRADGRPHVVPRDGVWMDDMLWYGGSPETVHNKIVARRPAVSVQVGAGLEAVIVEGDVERVMPDRSQAERVAEASNAKYPQYGVQQAEAYMPGVSVVRPRRVLAWTQFPTNATRFLFS